ncbi:hypothetical protein RvY_02570 [Ramazzottius varieornatus]|uniref:Uncharacterized protein n=1 Tax=Ramazzottius varieornatus TaxID=947166 RepID=A0A1D1UKY1_RAMVA|nr:hypothetical protein RvY_02570 [Ramazzottius varieornatus]
MWMDAISVAHEVRQMPPPTRIVLYRIRIANIDWSCKPHVVPCPSRKIPFVLNVNGPETLQYTIPPLEGTDYFSAKKSAHSPYEASELGKELIRLGHKYAKPFTQDELEDLSTSMDFFLKDMKLNGQRPLPVVIVLRDLISK